MWLETFFRQQPVVLFQIVAFAATGPRVWAFAAVLATWAIGALLTHTMLAAFDVYTRKAVLLNLRTYPGLIRVFSLQDIFPPPMVSRIGDIVLLGFRDSLGRSLTGFASGKTMFERALQEIRIYVRMPRSGQKRSIPFVAYPLRLGGYIFLRDLPKDLHGSGRFMLYHELGHMSLLGNYYAVRSRISYAPFALTAFVAMTQFEDSAISRVVLFGYLILLSGLQIYWSVRKDEGEFIQELMADSIGLHMLDDDEARRAAEALRRRQISDSNLPPEWERIRRFRLEINLQDVDKGRPDGTLFPKISGATPRPVWIALTATVVLACFARPYDAGAVIGVVLAALATSSLLIVFNIRNASLRAAVEREVKLRASSAGQAEVMVPAMTGAG